MWKIVSPNFIFSYHWWNIWTYPSKIKIHLKQIAVNLAQGTKSGKRKLLPCTGAQIDKRKKLIELRFEPCTGPLAKVLLNLDHLGHPRVLLHLCWMCAGFFFTIWEDKVKIEVLPYWLCLCALLKDRNWNFTSLIVCSFLPLYLGSQQAWAGEFKYWFNPRSGWVSEFKYWFNPRPG